MTTPVRFKPYVLMSIHIDDPSPYCMMLYNGGWEGDGVFGDWVDRWSFSDNITEVQKRANKSVSETFISLLQRNFHYAHPEGPRQRLGNLPEAPLPTCSGWRCPWAIPLLPFFPPCIAVEELNLTGALPHSLLSGLHTSLPPADSS